MPYGMSSDGYKSAEMTSLKSAHSTLPWELPKTAPTGVVPRRTTEDIEQLLRTLTPRSRSRQLDPPAAYTKSSEPKSAHAPTFHFLTPPPSPESQPALPNEISLNSAPPSQPPSPSFPPFVFVPPAPTPQRPAVFEDLIRRKPVVSFSDEVEAAGEDAYTYSPISPVPSQRTSLSDFEQVRLQLLIQHQLQQQRLQQSSSCPDLSALAGQVTVELASQPNKPKLSFKPGDWYCPMPECGYHNFCRNLECYRCAYPHPERSASITFTSSDKQFDQSTDWLDYLRKKTELRKSNLETIDLSSGDWRCECGFSNWRRRSICWQCHADHPSFADNPAHATLSPPTSDEKVAVLFPPSSTLAALPRRGEPVRIGARSRSVSSPSSTSVSAPSESLRYIRPSHRF